MPRATRSSIAQLATDAEEQDAEDVTAILNKEAANATPASSQKRKRISDIDGEIAKPFKTRGQARQSAVSTPMTLTANANSPRRQSGRLQARKSLAVPIPTDKRNPYEFPGEDGAVALPPAARGPAKKLRTLNKQGKKTASPFKNQGEIQTRTTAFVDLGESPRKRRGRRPTKTFNKIAKSLLRNVRPASQQNDAGVSDSIPFNGEDIFAAADLAAAERDVSRSPVFGRQPSEDVVSMPIQPGKAWKKASMPKSRRGNQATDNIQPGPKNLCNREFPAKPLNPLTEAAKQTHTAEDTSEYDDDDPSVEKGPEEGDVNDLDEDGAESPVEEQGRTAAGEDRDDFEEAESSQPPTRRPRTEAELRHAEQAKAEAEAKREEMIKGQLSGIESAVELHQCKNAWVDALVAAAEVAHTRKSSKQQSKEGGACKRKFKAMTRIYENMKRETAESTRRLSQDEQAVLSGLERQCEHICDFRYKPNMYHDLERKQMACDLYEHLIPWSLRLAKCGLKARFWNGDLSVTALEEISRLLDITYNLAEGARQWKPRPSLANAIKSKTQSDIKPNVIAITNAYRLAVDVNRRARYVDWCALQAAESLRRQKEEHNRMKDAVRAKYRRAGIDNSDQNGVHSDLAPSKAHSRIIDIDDILNDEPPMEYQPPQQPGFDDRQLERIRPAGRREPTEDIPAPDEPEWTEEELVSLVNALQRYTNESRWEDIMARYGGPRGRLHKYDMGQLIAKAKWVKLSMARHPRYVDESWNWLRSVPS